MSTCSNCYNGCTEIVSDRCVKYTGIDVPVLGIQTGDSLSFVEQALITFLVSTLDGTGIKIDLAPTVVCEVVNKYLPTCGDLSIVDISKALIEAACDLQEQVDAIVAELAILNGDYTIGCLTGVTASSDTHAIVQAVITKLCQVQVDLVALALDLDVNYVRYDELNALIAAYLASTGGSTKYYNRMIPFTVVEYYGTIPGNFDATGAGISTGPWEKIYLCNGLNGTPDKRGRVGVGVTNGAMLGLTLPPETNPSTVGGFNPLYSVGGTGSTTNQTVLSVGQIPSHTHTNTAASTATPHNHRTIAKTGGAVVHSSSDAFYYAGNTWSDSGTVSTIDSGIEDTVVTISTAVTINPFGGGGAHTNVQAGLGCYYIMYIP